MNFSFVLIYFKCFKHKMVVMNILYYSLKRSILENKYFLWCINLKYNWASIVVNAVHLKRLLQFHKSTVYLPIFGIVCIVSILLCNHAIRISNSVKWAKWAKMAIRMGNIQIALAFDNWLICCISTSYVFASCLPKTLF